MTKHNMRRNKHRHIEVNRMVRPVLIGTEFLFYPDAKQAPIRMNYEERQTKLKPTPWYAKHIFGVFLTAYLASIWVALGAAIAYGYMTGV